MVAITYLVAVLPVALSLPAFHLPNLPPLPSLPSITKLLNTVDTPNFSNDSDIVPGKYIVTFKPGVIATQFDLHMNWVRDIHARSVRKRAAGKTINEAVKAGVDKVWFNNFKGYSGEFDDETIATISKSNTVYAVEPVRVIQTNKAAVQDPSPWGLTSISRRNLGFNDYRYDDSGGQGMWAYVIDTGVNVAHVEFEGRAVLGYNAYPNTKFADVNGHGTHVAGTIIGKTYGVAKRANVMAVKVFDAGSSTTDIVLDGYEWAVNNITKTPGRPGRSVISMSLAGGKSDAFNAAIQKAYQSNVLTIVAAGNSYDDARNYSPASASYAMTVGAIDSKNTKPDFSNYGPAVQVFAPGVSIQSAWIGGNRSTNILSGTSMACPHIAGLALYLKGKESGLAPAGKTWNRILALSTKNKVLKPGTGSPNRMAFNGL